MSIARYFAKPTKTTTSYPSVSTTTFTVSGGYPVGQLDVFLNGVRLVSGDDYTATNGTTFTLTNAAISGDVVQYTVYPASPLTFLSTGGGTVTGATTFGPTDNPLTVSANTNNGLSIDSTGSPSLIWERSSVIKGYDAVIGTANDFVTGSAVDDRIFRGANGFLWSFGTTLLASLSSAGVLHLPYGNIKFPAAVNLSADANTLDDYEEGTWTPVWNASTTNPTATYAATTAGTYVKIGSTVFIVARITTATLTSAGSGNSYCWDLPFAASTNTGGYGQLVAGYRGGWTTTGPTAAYVEAGQSYVNLATITTATTFLTQANLSATTDLMLSGLYRTSA